MFPNELKVSKSRADEGAGPQRVLDGEGFGGEVEITKAVDGREADRQDQQHHQLGQTFLLGELFYWVDHGRTGSRQLQPGGWWLVSWYRGELGGN